MKINLINGNGKCYTTQDVTLILRGDYFNEVWLKHILDETGLEFKKNNWNGYTAKPTNPMQIVQFLTDASTHYWKVSYTDNWQSKATIYFENIDRREV